MKKMKPKKNSPTLLITDSPAREPTQDEIALAAYSIWDQAGRAQGRDVEHWLHAEAQFRQARQQGAVRM